MGGFAGGVAPPYRSREYRTCRGVRRVNVRCPYGSGKPQWLALCSFHPTDITIAADFQVVALLVGIRFGVCRTKAAFLGVSHPVISLRPETIGVVMEKWLAHRFGPQNLAEKVHLNTPPRPSLEDMKFNNTLSIDRIKNLCHKVRQNSAEYSAEVRAEKQATCLYKKSGCY